MKLLVIGIIILLAIVGGVYVFNSQLDNEETKDSALGGSVTQGPQTHTIQMSESGFSLSNIEITAGDTVTFTNTGNADMWPASAVHPTHRVYPGSDIEKCNTSEEKNIFDACAGIKPGESWSFTFNEKGNWNYHNHLNSAQFGKIAVK